MQDDDDDGGGFATACVNWNPEEEECYCMGEWSDIRNYGYGDDYSCEDFDSSGFLLASPGVSCSAACAAVGAECEANYSHSVDEMSCVFQYLGVTCRGMDGFTGGDYTPAVLIGTPWWGDDDDYVSSLDDAHCWYHNQGRRQQLRRGWYRLLGLHKPPVLLPCKFLLLQQLQLQRQRQLPQQLQARDRRERLLRPPRRQQLGVLQCHVAPRSRATVIVMATSTSARRV